MEKYSKHDYSGSRFTGNGSKANSQRRKTSFIKIEKPRFEDREYKKEETTMNKEKRLAFLTLLQKVMGHPYGVVFNDIENIRGSKAEFFEKLERSIDLEMVKSMLEKNLYTTVEEFAEDVRTTFSNALQIFPATTDVYKMATKLSEYFEEGFKTTVEAMNGEPKTCNNEEVFKKKETQGKKIDSSSRKRKSEAARTGRKKIYVLRQEPDKESNPVSITGTNLVNEKKEKCFNITVVTVAPEKTPERPESPMAKSPRRMARVAELMERFSGTINKAQKLLSASAPKDRDQKKKEAELKVEKRRKRVRETHQKVQERRKREREALERMENTAKFDDDHEALRDFEWLLRHSEFKMTGINTSSSDRHHSSVGEDGAEHTGLSEVEEGEILEIS